MPVATDRFIASFGDTLLEFELAIDAIRFESGEVAVDWSVEKVTFEFDAAGEFEPAVSVGL